MRTASEAWDERFMTHSTVVRTCPIPTGNVAATDFSLADADQRQLIDGGRQAANTYLDNFRTRDYMNTFGQKLVE